MAEAPPKFAEGKCFGHYLLSLNKVYMSLALWHSLPSAAAVGVSPPKSGYGEERRHDGELDFQEVFDGIDATESLEREVLVVHNHPVLALLAAEALDVGKHRDGHDDLATVGQVGRHRAALHVEVQLLDAQSGVLVFAHIYIVASAGNTERMK